jgi:hypothetical protein
LGVVLDVVEHRHQSALLNRTILASGGITPEQIAKREVPPLPSPARVADVNVVRPPVEELLARLPNGYDSVRAFAVDEGGGVTSLYFERLQCSTGKSHIYKLTVS